MVRDFRYLGSHINTAGGRRASTLDGRFDKAVAMLRRLKRLYIAGKAKVKTIRTVVYPAALYGVEASSTTRTKTAALAAGLITRLIFKQLKQFVAASKRESSVNLGFGTAANSIRA